MDTKIPDPKSVLRLRLREQMRKISGAQRAAASAQVCSLLEKQKVWKSANSILFFAPLPDEPDIWPLISRALDFGKTVTLPRFLPETETYIACRVLNPHVDVEIGKYGIREPSAVCADVPLNQLDFILVPGVAFDLNGGRLGRGQGYYDRLLAEVRGMTCGVAFEQQIVGEVPAEPHDVRLNCILTPTRWAEPKQRDGL